MGSAAGVRGYIAVVEDVGTEYHGLINRRLEDVN